MSASDWLISIDKFRGELGADGKHYFMALKHGSMMVELFAPREADTQKPHKQDELYFITKGTAVFNRAGERRAVKAGDGLFVEAGVEHRFEDFSPDFETWVVFWGPEGGEI